MAQLPKHRVELIGKGVTGACIALVALLVVTLVAMVAQRGIATFAVDGIDLGAFLTGTTWNPHQDDVNGMPTVGALPMISGSFAVTLLSTLFALPIAIGSAIFVVEIAPRFGRRVFQPLIELLVGIPSVVYGLIGLTVVVAWTRDMAAAAGQTITGFGIFSSAIVLAVMILPTITSLSIDALAAVPNQYREGSYALGCTLMLMQQPLVADDLRYVSGSFRLVSDLAHIDSKARDVAYLATQIPHEAASAIETEIATASGKVACMVKTALESFADADRDRAEEVFASDDEVDALYERAEQVVVDLIRRGDADATHLPELLMAAKYFERMGDDAERIAKWTIFRITGTHDLKVGETPAE